MKTLRRFALFGFAAAATACASPVAPDEPALDVSVNAARLLSQQSGDQLATTADSATARGGGNLMGGN
jgi:hypothetical protein